MSNTSIRSLHCDSEAIRHFRVGVSLHGHTLHSREGISLLTQIAKKTPGVASLCRYQHRRLGGDGAYEEDVAKFFWTSPLSAGQALGLERRQIEQKLGLEAQVSISDHDNIDAPLQLQFLEPNHRVPVSVEWTAPFAHSYFHLGVHNLPVSDAVATMERMRMCTEERDPRAVHALLHNLARQPEVLIVFNHPLWDLPRVGEATHHVLLREFIAQFKTCVHALEINGLRDRSENKGVIKLAEETGLPIISGGDRHGREPNAVLNLTNAATFAEFVSEIRAGHSQLLVMPQYYEPQKLRIIQTIWDIVREDDEHSLGWTRWQDRVFRVGSDGSVRSMSQLLTGRDEPLLLKQFVRTIRLLASPRLRPALQFALAEGPELAF